MSIAATLAAEFIATQPKPAAQAPANQALFKRLSRPLPWFHPKKTYYGLVQALLRTVGKLSDGIALGWDAGFDSGPMLDYVYQNQARGRGWLGRWLDRRYLNGPGWRGIRQRRRNLQALLTETLLRFERPVHIVFPIVIRT